jgi:hypothetical protein
MSALSSLDAAIRAAGIPINGVSAAAIDYKQEATTEQRAQGDAILAGFDFGDAAELLRQHVRERIEAKLSLIQGNEALKRAIRAAVKELFTQDKAISDRVNGIISILTNAQKTTIAANGYPTTLLPNRTLADFVDIIEAAIDADA